MVEPLLLKKVMLLVELVRVCRSYQHLQNRKCFVDFATCIFALMAQTVFSGNGYSGKVNKDFTDLWPSDFLISLVFQEFPPCPSISSPYALVGFPHGITHLISFPSFSNIFKLIPLLSITDTEG